jgi:hypothetical protein
MASTTPAKGDDDKAETYSAKQVATRIGTDAKTLRKFFRSPKSTFTAVGQGGRYEFPKSELPAIKEAFDAWKNGKPGKSDAMRSKPESVKEPSKGPVGKLSRQGTKHKPGPVTTRRVVPAGDPVISSEDIDDDLFDDDPDMVVDLTDEEPTEDDLAEVEDLELDLDDLDEDDNS